MKDPRCLSQVMAYIDDHLTSDIYLSSLAEVAGMSLFHFCRFFKRNTGMTPHRYVLMRRMELAKRILTREYVSLREVAYKTGFTNQSQFSRVFLRVTGMTPIQCRRSSQ